METDKIQIFPNNLKQNRMNKSLCILLMVTLLVFSCKKKVEDAKDIHVFENIVQVQSVINEWLDYYESIDIKIDSFVWRGTESLPDLTHELRSAALYSNDIYPLLKYSPDSLRLLDIFSYNLILEENELGLMQYGTEADTEVILNDLYRTISSRLLFVGPSVRVEDGFWKDNNNIVLVGFYREPLEEGFRPVQWHINLDRRTIDFFEYYRSFKHFIPDYLEKVKYKDFEHVSPLYR